MKGKGDMMDCSQHWYLDALMMLFGVLFLFGTDGWGLVNFQASYYLPPWGLLFLFFGVKMYYMNHMKM